MTKDANEIRSVVSRLETTGDYDRLASAEADHATAEVADMLAEVLVLSEEDADELWARDSGSCSDLSREEHDERARRVAHGQRSDASVKKANTLVRR